MYNDELTKKLAETAKRIIAGESVENPIEEGANKDTKGDKEAYQKFFNDTLKKYGVKSPAELKGDDEKKFYDEIDAGWKADDEKPEKNESVELEEAKIDLNKKFNTSDAAFDYFHSFAVADQAKTDQEVEKSKKKFAKNTLGFWMQNLSDTLKGMGISEETEVELTDEEEDEIVASILDTIPDAEAAPDEYEDDINLLDGEDFQDDGISEETEKLDARRRQFREKIKQLAYTKAKQMIKGIVDADDEEVEGINSSLEVQKDEATGAVFVSHVKEEIEGSTELGEAKSEKYKEKINGKYDKNRVTAGYEIEKGEGVKVVSLGNFETVEDALLALKKIPSNWTDKYYTLGNQKFGERKLSESIDAVSVSHVKEETEEPEIIQIARRIVKNQQFEKIKDPVSGKRMEMDMFTANAITKVYDALSDANKANMVKYPLPKMVDIVFKLLK
jgi:hypothetical protein